MTLEQQDYQREIEKGIKLMEGGKVEEAINIFEKIKKNKNTEIIGLLFLGISNIKKKNNEKAKSYFLNILEISGLLILLSLFLF